MPVSPAPWSPPALLPDHPYRFSPVPRVNSRKNGWTSDRQHAFIWALAKLPSVAAAARSVGMSARSAYRLRDAPGADAFAAAWDDALTIGIDAARDTAIDRATEGVVVPVIWRGRIVGEKRRYNDRLLLSALGSAAMEQKGLLAHARRIADRNAVRAADRLHGGPVGADAIAAALSAEAKALANPGERASIAEARSCRPGAKRLPPRAGIGVTRL